MKMTSWANVFERLRLTLSIQGSGAAQTLPKRRVGCERPMRPRVRKVSPLLAETKVERERSEQEELMEHKPVRLGLDGCWIFVDEPQVPQPLQALGLRSQVDHPRDRENPVSSTV